MLLLSLPFKTPSEATSLLPLAPFTVNWTATPFPSSDDLLRPKKGSHPHLSAQEKHPDCKQKARGRSSPPRCSLSKRSGLDRHRSDLSSPLLLLNEQRGGELLPRAFCLQSGCFS